MSERAASKGALATPTAGADPRTQVVALLRAKMSPAAVPKGRRRIALGIAVVADLVQMGGFPIFSQGALSIPDGVLDAVVALVLLITLGFRWRLLFSLALELVPFATLFPTWSAVVMSLPTIPELDDVDMKKLPPQIKAELTGEPSK